MLENVHVVGSELDGIHVRRASVMIDGCTVSSPAGPWVQGIDISFSMDKEMSMVERCTIVGVREGIVTHMSMVDVEHNRVGETSLRGITMGEMSMGSIRDNDVLGAHGVGIICLDHSECEIEDNTIAGTKVDASDPAAQRRRDPGALLRQGAARRQHGGREPRRHRGARQLHDHAR